MTTRRSTRRATWRNGPAARHVPGATEEVDVATRVLGLLRGDLIDPRPELAINDPWLAARDSVDRGYAAAARSAIASLRAGGTTCQAMAHALGGSSTTDEDHWHEALRIADRHGLRLIAVDAFEAIRPRSPRPATASPRRCDCSGRGRAAPRRDRLRVALARRAAHLRRRTPHAPATASASRRTEHGTRVSSSHGTRPPRTPGGPGASGAARIMDGPA